MCRLEPTPASDPTAVQASLRDLVDLSRPESADGWRAIDDTVMGGVSSSRFVGGPEGTGRFTGTVSLERNGGFASVRTPVTWPGPEPVHGIALEVRGDGKVYKLSLRGDRATDGVSWQAPFSTIADTWTTVWLPLDAFAPTWRGRLVTDAPPFDPARLHSLGLSIGDKQAGSFRLDVRRIAAWRDGTGGSLPVSRPFTNRPGRSWVRASHAAG